jgi:hypothetical protein
MLVVVRMGAHTSRRAKQCRKQRLPELRQPRVPTDCLLPTEAAVVATTTTSITSSIRLAIAPGLTTTPLLLPSQSLGIICTTWVVVARWRPKHLRKR